MARARPSSSFQLFEPLLGKAIEREGAGRPLLEIMIKEKTGKIFVVDDEVELKNVLVEALTSQELRHVGL